MAQAAGVEGVEEDTEGVAVVEGEVAEVVEEAVEEAVEEGAIRDSHRRVNHTLLRGQT